MLGCSGLVLGIIEGAKDGKGRGKQVISVAMTCSLILVCLDVTKPLTQKRKIEHELEGFGMRLNKKAPNIIITKADKGGINITVAPGYRLIGMDEETVVTICKEFRITNASIVFRCNASSDDLIDVIEGNGSLCWRSGPWYWYQVVGSTYRASM